MEKIKNLIDRLGEKLFPALPERKRRRITVQTELDDKDLAYAELDLQKQEYLRKIVNVK